MTTPPTHPLLAPIQALHRHIRAEVVRACEQAAVSTLADVARDDEGDTIYDIDRVAEHTLVDAIERTIASAEEPVLLVAEGIEGGEVVIPSGAPRSRVRWVIVVDPIDGTVNFVYGIPAYAVSIGAQIGGISVAGSVIDVVSGELYSASVGAGAHMTSAGKRRAIRCNDVDELSMALLGTGFGYAPRRRTEQSRLLANMLPLVRDVRRIGSASLDLCLVASGRLDAHYEHGLHVWDWAAGAVIAAEAGAVVRLPQSRGSSGGAGLALVSAPGIADELIATLDRFGGLEPLAT